ncbi:MAG: hypothetical protein ACI8P9_002225 [Parasphingorhabdus sp.]
MNSAPQSNITEQLFFACIGHGFSGQGLDPTDIDFDPEAIDWTRLMYLAGHHNLVLLLSHVIERTPRLDVPESLRSKLRQGRVAARLKSLFFSKELVRVDKLFAENDIDRIWFKGPSLEQIAYAASGYRNYNDLDVLIAPGEIHRARDLLLNHEYFEHFESGSEQTSRQIQLERRDQRAGVDLHVGLSTVSSAMQIPTEAVMDQRKIINISGSDISTFNTEVNLLMLVLQGAKGHWYQLSRVIDLHALISNTTPIDWGKVSELADQFAPRRVFNLAMYNAEMLCGTKIPGHISIEARADNSVARVFLVIKKHSVRHKTIPGIIRTKDRVGWFYAYGYIAKLRYFRTKIPEISYRILKVALPMVTPNERDYAFFSLPNKLRLLYYPLKPFRLLFQRIAR